MGLLGKRWDADSWDNWTAWRFASKKDPRFTASGACVLVVACSGGDFSTSTARDAGAGVDSGNTGGQAAASSSGGDNTGGRTAVRAPGGQSSSGGSASSTGGANTGGRTETGTGGSGTPSPYEPCDPVDAATSIVQSQSPSFCPSIDCGPPNEVCCTATRHCGCPSLIGATWICFSKKLPAVDGGP